MDILVKASARLTFLFSLLTIWGTLAHAAATVVRVQNRQLFVNNQVFTVKGVNYTPVPVGSTGGAPETGCLNAGDWWADRPAYIADFPLIRQMGANTIRTYNTMNDVSATNVALVRAMLDKAHENGIYVIMAYYPAHDVSVTNPAFQASIQTNFIAAVNAYKDHPAVLMWALGNEQNIDNGQDPAWYPFVNTVLGLAKQADPNHPTTTVEAECPQCLPAYGGPIALTIGAGVKADASMTNLDVWSFNTYRGKSFSGLFETLGSTTTKPLLLTEFGKDAFNDSTQAEDQAMQVRYVTAQWSEIETRLNAQDSTRPLIGAVWFAWDDGWWKGSGAGASCQSHDNASLFSRSDDTDDPIYNEEWFGLVSIRPINAISNPSGTARTLRASYTTFQTLWAGSSSSGSSASSHIFNGTVRNFPNPFRVGAEGTKFVALTGRAAKVNIRIYDAGGQFVASLTQDTAGPERVELNWDGRVGSGAYVSPGLYVVRIDGTGPGASDETQFRRVVAVK